MRAVSRSLSFQGGALTSGDVHFDSKCADASTPDRVVAVGISHVPEGRQVFARMTVTDNLRAGALGFTGSRADRAAALRRVHELFPVLAERGAQRAGLLSGGEQQMLAVGRALMASPRLLLLDEPSLDPLMAARIADTIREIDAQGMSVLLVEQNAAIALRLASRAYVLDVGEVALAGPADELAASDEVRRRYLGVVDEDAAADAVPLGGRTVTVESVPPPGSARRDRPLRRAHGVGRRQLHRRCSSASRVPQWSTRPSSSWSCAATGAPTAACLPSSPSVSTSC